MYYIGHHFSPVGLFIQCFNHILLLENLLSYYDLKPTIRENIIIYGIILGIGLIAFIYIVIAEKIALSSIPSIAIALGNTWGLFLLVILMGYGFVEIPRMIRWMLNR